MEPHGVAVEECFVEYGATAPYKMKKKYRANVSPAPKSGAVGVAADIEELEPNTEYHYRFGARNSYGVSYGTPYKSFTTLLNSGTGSSADPSTPAEATTAPLTATASGGTGTVTVGEYAADPVGEPSFMSSNRYVDLNILAGYPSFASVAASRTATSVAATSVLVERKRLAGSDPARRIDPSRNASRSR